MSEEEPNDSELDAQVLRGGLVGGSLSGPNDRDFYRTGTNSSTSIVAQAGDALSITFDSPTNHANLDTISVSVIDTSGRVLARVADGRDFSFTTGLSSAQPFYYVVVDDLSDQYGLFPSGNNGIAYYVDPGDPFPDFFAPPPGTAFTGLGGISIEEELFQI